MDIVITTNNNPLNVVITSDSPIYIDVTTSPSIEVIVSVNNGGVPASRTVNGYPLTEDIVLNTDDLSDDGRTNKFVTQEDIDNWNSIPAIQDATNTTKGAIKLSGDLGGTADLPTVPGLGSKMDKIKNTKIVSATTYTLLDSDSDKTLYFTSSSPVILTIPTGLMSGNLYEVFQQGGGYITIAGSGTTLRYTASVLPITSGMNSIIGIQSITNVSEEYKVMGELQFI